MSLKAWEKATLNFYEWDYLGRGYYLFPEQVNLEPKYYPFSHGTAGEDKYVDDGKVPGFFDSLNTLFQSKEIQLPEKPIEEKKLASSSDSPELNVVLEITFRKGEEISTLISQEFLGILSYTIAPVSFEILGSKEKITIQLVCAGEDATRLQSNLKGFFSTVIIQQGKVTALPFDPNHMIGICDFGLAEEMARPITVSKNYLIDPLTSLIATMEYLQDGQSVMMQVIFKGTVAPWSRDIVYAVSDGMGGSFFSDSPEMTSCAADKVSTSLFSCVVRIAVQGNHQRNSQALADQLINSVSTITNSSYNSLIPLSNKGYDYDIHLANLYDRKSNRLGMLLNAQELATLVHYPNKTVHSLKLGVGGGTTKALPQIAIQNKYSVGINLHNGIKTEVTIDDQSRLRHTHIIGTTGTGKSTFIANLIAEDIRHGNGCALFDPHGDIVQDVLERIPKERHKDVVLIDPADTEFPVGFNLLQASTEIEKIVLSSDLVNAFKRHATAWGDNMTAVLTNAINAFLESKKQGTLIELKRFLIEERFREQFLKTVDDQSILYYWQYEYPMVKKGIAPLLTRIDTFLRPKTLRHMFAQKSGVNFKACLESNKIILIKLSQGLIGTENSYLLGSLFLSKLHQAAQSRQQLQKSERKPFYVYLDEFQNFITPSITSILSGARKYGLGLVLAHQELAQIDDKKILNSVISNPYTRICFRLGDNDAKYLESGFDGFEQQDLQSLAVGETVTRIGGSHYNFNMRTTDLETIDRPTAAINSDAIIEYSRKHYAIPIEEAQKLLRQQLPQFKSVSKDSDKPDKEPLVENTKIEVDISPELTTQTKESLEIHKQDFIKQSDELIEIKKHQALQLYIKEIGQKRDFKATLEQQTPQGGRVDIGLEKDNLRIAIEISVTNTLDYEVQNIQKCIEAGYTYVYMVSENRVHLNNIKKRARKLIDQTVFKKVLFLAPIQLATTLDAFASKKKKPQKRVRGYLVKSNQVQNTAGHPINSSKGLKDIILSGISRKQ